MKIYDLIIVGAGASGMLSAIEAKKAGLENVLLIDKDPALGGNLNLCNYKVNTISFEDSNEYKADLINKISELYIDVLLNTMVININDNGDIICTSSERGLEVLKAKNIILANGSKEKGLQTLTISGDRVSGVLSLKTAKKIFNIENTVPGKKIVIYGTENLSLIENELKTRGVEVVAIVGEDLKLRYLNLTNHFHEGYRIKSIIGKDRISSIIITNGSEEKEILCDTLIFAQGLLSDGLVSFRSNIALNPKTTGPMVDENYQTSRKNIFALGDGIYIHESHTELKKEANTIINYIAQTI